MKTIKLLSSIIVLALVITSCKSGMDLTKRHYTKGYYFHKTKSLDQPTEKEAVAVNTQKEKSTQMAVITPSLPPSTDKVEFTGELKTTAVANTFAKQDSKKIQNVSSGSSEKKETVLSKKVKSGSSIQQKNKQAAARESGAKFVLMVILCFFPFLSLIPVYIHDSGVTLNFWLTLILHLTFIGYIIFSLLVLFDVVNLA